MADWTGIYLILMCSIAHGVGATGRMLVPPQRSSLWRDPIQKYNPRVAKNFEDHRLNCGGLWRKKRNDGQCGVCGDPWDSPEPRPNEAGGVFAQGVIGRTYFPTDRFIPVKVEIISNIDGYFEFKLCPNNDVNKKVTQACLDRNPLKIFSEDKWTNYGTRFYPDLAPITPGNISFALEIPTGMTCQQCVLQWKWHGGNNWGKCPNGTSATGCGPQMEFYNCADISILGTGDTVPANVPGNSQPGQSIRDAVSKALQAGMRASMGNPTSSIPPKVGAPAIDPKRGPKPLSGQNVNPSTLANGMPNTSTREASALDMLRRNTLSNNNVRQSGSMGVREPVMTDLSSMFARGNGMNSANMASAFRNSLMQQYRQALPFSTGRNAQSSFAAASPLSSILSTLSPNRQNTRLQQLAMNNMASGSLLKYLQLLQNASNSAGNMTQNRGINDLTQLLTQGSQRSLRGGLNMPIVERMINLQGLMSDSTVNRSRNLANMVANARSTLLSPSGERGMTGGATTASAVGSNFAPGYQFSQVASLLGGGSGTGAPNMALTPELLMMSSLLGRSGGSGGSEAGEGGGTSRVNPLMMLNPELGMMTSLLGRGTQRGGEGSEGGKRSTGMHSGSMNPQMKALATLFGTSSRAGGEGAMGGRSSSGFGLSSLFGMNARGGAEAAEGGRSSSRMGFASLFGGRSTAGGEGGEGGRTSGGLNTMSMMLPLLMGSNSGFGGIGSSRNMGLTGGNPFGPVNPLGSNAELMLLSSFLGRGSRRGGGSEAAEGGEAGGSGMGGMSNLPLLAMMLGDGFGRGPMARQQMPGLNTAQGALLQQRPQTKPYGGLALPGIKPVNMPPMLKGRSPSPIAPPLLGAPLNRRSTMRMAQMRSPLMPNTGMNAMQSGRFARSRSPSVSLLDLYRLTGSLGGRRRTRMID